jgi:hypothetical protein
VLLFGLDDRARQSYVGLAVSNGYIVSTYTNCEKIRMNRPWSRFVHAGTTYMLATMLLFPLLFLPGSAYAASTNNDLGDSATLVQLVSQPATISDGSLRIGQFDLLIDPASTKAPALSDITVAVNTSPDTLQSFLNIVIDGPARILTAGETYEMALSYSVEALTSGLEISQVSLDIDGGTLGTRGTSLVQVESNFGAIDAMAASVSTELLSTIPVTQLVVFNDGDGDQRLTAASSLPNGVLQLAVGTTVHVDGGINSASGAVLTDFSVGFARSIVIPEPATLILASLTLFILLARAARRLG